MADIEQVLVPDIGGFEDVEIIEVLVSPGDRVEAEQSLITLESDKASMEVPAPLAGTVKELHVQLGDRVSEGTKILSLEPDSTKATDASGDTEPRGEADAAADNDTTETTDTSGRKADDSRDKKADSTTSSASADSKEIEVKVPDIGDFKEVEVIEVLVQNGDEIEAEQSLITLESDKASMEVPAPEGGRVVAMKCRVGDKVSEGSTILTMTTGSTQSASKPSTSDSPDQSRERDTPSATSKGGDSAEARPRPAPAATTIEPSAFRKAHASPAVRRFARELGADVTRIAGTGPKGRILKDDVKAWIKQALSAGAAATGADTAAGVGIPSIPDVDFSQFGEIETTDLPRIKRISGPHLHRAWLNLPMVTHHDDADITELETFRKSLQQEAEQQGVRVTALVFIMKALVDAMTTYPNFNASLSGAGQKLVYKKYFHIGLAVDTPKGLMVPVVRDVNRKGVYELSAEIAELSAKARDGKLKPAEMQGGCISISSLGGIGGSSFTPIVNAPEVAILGVTRARMQPIWDGSEFVPRLMLPLDLTYDHRVIDGADAARFCARLCRTLGDVRRLIL